MNRGAILIISGPSGCGKSSILRKILPKLDNYYFSISTTTRDMRDGEIDGIDYNFITQDEFKIDIENGMFIISLKPFLQNITLGNETNLGFKVFANEKNDPFESINFDIENESAKPILEIIYVAN